MHRNAKLTPAGRRILVERIQSGRPAAHVAAEMGVARKTAYKWWQRWLAEGEAGLQDRSSRPQRSPARVPARLERRIERLRRRRKLGPARIAWRLRMAPSTVYRVLCRLGLNRLSWLDRPTGRVIRRRYEHPRPGDLLHMDVKKLGRIPPGGGWRVHGRGRDRHHGHSRVGYAYPESTDGLGCAGCRARNGRFGGCGSGWWRWQGATVAVRACGQEETAVGRRSQACWRQAVERSARPSGVRSGAGSPAAGRGRR